MAQPLRTPVPANNNNIVKKPVPYPERNGKPGKDKGGYGLLMISGLVLVIGGIVGALIQFTKKKKASS